MTALLVEAGPPVAAALLGVAWLFGHRAGARREADRNNNRAVAMMELRRTIDKASR